MSVRATHPWSLLCLLVLACCAGDDIATQTVVCVDIGEMSRARAEALRIEVFDQDGMSVLSREDPLPPPGTPARVPLSARGGDASRAFSIRASLVDAGVVFSEVFSRGGYVADELRVLPLRFSDMCIDVRCPGDSQCVADIAGPRCDASAPLLRSPAGAALAAICPSSECAECSECEECIAGACMPKPGGTACGECAGDVCAEGSCVPEASVATFALGDSSTCASVEVSGEGRRTFCWGRNAEAQLATGSASELETSPQDTELDGALQHIALGDRHGCAIGEDQELVCWGANDVGQLGDAAAGSGPRSVDIGSPPRGVAAGHGFSCAFSAMGFACWGAGNLGQLGNDCGGASASPVFREQADIETIEAGARHACIVFTNETETDEEVRCWGDNNAEQDWFDGPTTVCTPEGVGVRSNVRSLAVGEDYHCFVGNDGGVRCSGSNADGQLGSPLTVTTARNRIIPFSEDRPTDDKVNFVRAGRAHTVLQIGPQLYTLGDNLRGQLGRFGEGPDPEPTVGQWRTARAGGNHTCATTTDGRLYCWGANESGQLGDATLEDRPAPTRVCFRR